MSCLSRGMEELQRVESRKKYAKDKICKTQSFKELHAYEKVLSKPQRPRKLMWVKHLVLRSGAYSVPHKISPVVSFFTKTAVSHSCSAALSWEWVFHANVHCGRSKQATENRWRGAAGSLGWSPANPIPSTPANTCYTLERWCGEL